jgi:ubiquinone/menaquinone biosynthesis C-methylase UbiE
MPNYFDMAAHVAGQTARVGWYYGLARLLEVRADRLGIKPQPYKPQRPQPKQADLFRALGDLMLDDAARVRDGVYPPMPEDGERLARHFSRVRLMFDDLPQALERRQTRNASTVKTVEAARDLPDYFTQDFHFQTGGYLTEDSAKLYDMQVETLFMGSAGLMRRTCLAPVHDALKGKDQRDRSLLDVACGTGRFLRQARLAFPGLKLTGLDLSASYLREAERHMGTLRPARLLEANAEAIPLPDASQDIVTNIYLFHELPPEVRRTVAREMARVLKPGGTLVFMDSLQFGDQPDWDGMLEAFPVRFHEPYFRHYAIDKLDDIFTGVGLEPVPEGRALPFISKRLVYRKPL